MNGLYIACACAMATSVTASVVMLNENKVLKRHISEDMAKEKHMLVLYQTQKAYNEKLSSSVFTTRQILRKASFHFDGKMEALAKQMRNIQSGSQEQIDQLKSSNNKLSSMNNFMSVNLKQINDRLAIDTSEFADVMSE